MTADLHRRWLTHIEHRDLKGISAEAAALYAEVGAALEVSESQAAPLQIKADFTAEQLDGLPTFAAEVRAALADLPVGRVTLTLDGLEAQWAAERLGLEDVERVQVEFVRKLEPHPESPFDITGAP